VLGALPCLALDASERRGCLLTSAQPVNFRGRAARGPCTQPGRAYGCADRPITLGMLQGFGRLDLIDFHEDVSQFQRWPPEHFPTQAGRTRPVDCTAGSASVVGLQGLPARSMVVCPANVGFIAWLTLPGWQQCLLLHTATASGINLHGLGCCSLWTACAVLRRCRPGADVAPPASPHTCSCPGSSWSRIRTRGTATASTRPPSQRPARAG
jgi:hypothetical protein